MTGAAALAEEVPVGALAVAVATVMEADYGAANGSAVVAAVDAMSAVARAARVESAAHVARAVNVAVGAGVEGAAGVAGGAHRPGGEHDCRSSCEICRPFDARA